MSKHHTIAMVKLPPNKKSDEHFHKEREESYFVLEGRGRVVIDGCEFEIQKGSLIHTKPNERHEFINDGSVEFKYVNSPH